MSFDHHGKREPMDPELRKAISDRDSIVKLFAAQRNGTAQREFPHGRISGEDDGAIAFMVSADPERKLVTIDFGTSTKWIAMTPQQAIEIAQSLIKQARSIATEPLRIVLH